MNPLAFFDADATMVSLLILGWVIIPCAVGIVIVARHAWKEWKDGGL